MNFNFFKCSHPFDSLFVAKDATQVEADLNFYNITYHFHCQKCGKDLDKTYAKMIGGVDAFMKRGL